MILKTILKSPGIRYRQLLRSTGLSNGTLSHILKALEISKYIVVSKVENKKVVSYFPKETRTRESRVMANLTNETDMKIVMNLLAQGESSFTDITKHINKSPSTVSWHISRLRNANIVTSMHYNNRLSTYKLKDKKFMSELVHKYARELKSES